MGKFRDYEKESKMRKTERRSISIEPSYLSLFSDYVASHPQFTLSSFLVTAGVSYISRARGAWLERIKRIERAGEIPRVDRETFESMTREEKWGVIERLQG